MSIDLEALLREVSADAPSGENLEYDAGFAELERASLGKPEQQMGDTVIPGEEPDWKTVRSRATELLARSKDLRVAVHLALAELRLEGLAGFSEGLALVRGLLETYWETLHPQLDPDDDYDPTMRVNALAPLAAPETTLRALRESYLVQSRALGRFSYRDFLLATGALTPPEGKAAPELASIDGAFADAPLDSVQATEKALTDAQGHVRAIETSVTDRVGAEQTADLSALNDLLRAMRRVVSDRVALRTQAGAEAAPPEAEEASYRAGPGAGPATAAAPRAAPGEIRSREDVVKTLERVCDYYARNEPSSPVPLLLRRAQRLAGKSFMEIIQDLAPDAVSEIERIRGVEESAGVDSGYE